MYKLTSFIRTVASELFCSVPTSSGLRGCTGLHSPTNFIIFCFLNAISTLYAFDYADSESEFQFTLSRHNLIIFDCKYCKNAKYTVY